MVLVIPILAACQAIVCGFVTWKLLHVTHLAAFFALAAAYGATFSGLRGGAPRIGYPLGLLLAYSWAVTFGLSAYTNPQMHGAAWFVGFYASVGLALGALANVVNPVRPWIWIARLPARMLGALRRPGRSQPRHHAPPRGHPRTEPPPTPPTPQPATPDPWSILGIAPGATPDAIQSAYRQRMREYHPDRVHTLGAEIRELAERKAKQINAAYETLRGLREEQRGPTGPWDHEP